jgi:hypothetical protein
MRKSMNWNLLSSCSDWLTLKLGSLVGLNCSHSDPMEVRKTALH